MEQAFHPNLIKRYLTNGVFKAKVSNLLDKQYDQECGMVYRSYISLLNKSHLDYRNCWKIDIVVVKKNRRVEASCAH